MTSWKRGDLGRFAEESKTRPRFEVLGSDPKKGVALWYGGEAYPVFMPRNEFISRARKDWEISIVPPLPDWLRKGATFRIDDFLAGHITQAEVKQRFGAKLSQVDVRGHDLMVRNIQYDYASCKDEQSGCLVLVSVIVLLNHGFQVKSALDRLLYEEDDL